jgi:predicted AlkP superfamily phosphohydrolase/phosphomutase
VRLRGGALVLPLVALGWIGAAGCGARERPHVDRRVIVLGFDGMDYGVAESLMARGLMPNFSRLSKSGTFMPLATTTPPQSPVAWSSFITGLDPGGHGIFDFVHRDQQTLAPYLSTTRTDPPARRLTIGSWQLPLSGARVTLLREGQPFWEVLEQHGVRSTIIRMPANFPPSGTATRELGGMGTPDLLGTYGTFSFFSTSPAAELLMGASGGRVTTVSVVDHIVHGELPGPDNPFRTPARPVPAPFTVYIDPVHPAAKILVGEEERVLQAGEWSDWVPIDYPLMPLQTVRGMARFFLKQVRPTFELYASPINIDPEDPAMPISTPASYAAEIAAASGRFYTQGLAEDTKGLSAGILTPDEFLQQAASVNEEVLRQYATVLGGFTEGLLFYYFGDLDQVSHMMWRARDPGHPAYDRARDEPYAHVIDDLYIAFDRIVGQTLQAAGAQTTVVVMSDHGFTSWRRSFNLNGWLRDQGYLAVRDPRLVDDASALGNIDWSRTRAYGLGLNGLYVNVRGRERLGIVGDGDRRALVDEIRQKLLATIDPFTDGPVVTAAHAREDVFTDGGHADRAPDVIIGYARGTRVSNESAIGAVPRAILSENRLAWSGDHCMDASTVPGLLLTSRPLATRVSSITDLAAAILAEFGIRGFPAAR